MNDIDTLERQYQAPGDPAAPLVQRIINLEQRLFGAPQSGSMVDRLQSLKSATNRNPQRQQAPFSFQGPAAGNANSNWTPSAGMQAGGPVGVAMPRPGRMDEPLQTGSQPNPNANINASGWVPNQPAPANFQGAEPGQIQAPQNQATPAAVQGWQAQGNPNRNAILHPVAPLNLQKVPANAGPPVQGWQVPQGRFPAAPQTMQAPTQAAEAGIPAGEQRQQSVPYNRMVSAPVPLQGSKIVKKNFAPDALPLLNAFPPNLVRMEPDNTALIARPDYYQDVYKASKGKAIRFKSMPIPVYIQPYPDKAFVNCVVRAFESWEQRTNGAVKFSQIDNPNQARIQVIWKHLGGNKDSSGCLLGAHTILKYTNRGNGSLSLVSVGAVPVPIYIPRLGPKYTVPPQVMEVNLDLISTKEPSAKYPCLQNIVTHELGHALGLLGHSPNQADIMYPVTDEHSRLSQRDVNTVIKLYDQKCDIPL